MKLEYEVDRTTRFKRDLKKVLKRGCDENLLDEIIEKLRKGEKLPEKNKDHALHGNWENYRECHIQPDWLLVYRYLNDILVLSLVRTGTHSDILE